MEKRCRCAGSSAAWAVYAKRTVYQAGKHQFRKGEREKPVHQRQSGSCKNQGPANIK